MVWTHGQIFVVLHVSHFRAAEVLLIISSGQGKPPKPSKPSLSHHKTKMMAIKAIQVRTTFTCKWCITSNILAFLSHQQIGDSSDSQHRHYDSDSNNSWMYFWHQYESRLQVGWNTYHMFKNQCRKIYNWGWEVRLMLFNTMVVQVLLMKWNCGWYYLTQCTEWNRE